MRTLACCVAIGALGACGCAHAIDYSPTWFSVNHNAAPGSPQECDITLDGEDPIAAVRRVFGVEARVVKEDNYPIGRVVLVRLPNGAQAMFTTTPELCHEIAAYTRSVLGADAAWYFANPRGGDCDPMARRFPEAASPVELRRLMADRSGLQLELVWNGSDVVRIHDPSGSIRDLVAVRGLALCRQVSEALAEIGGG